MKPTCRGLVLLTSLALVLGLGWARSPKSGSALVRPVLGAALGEQDEFNSLLRSRYETGAHLLQIEEKRLNQGVTTLAHVCEVARWVRDSALELPLTTGERMGALSNYVALTRRLDESMTRATEAGAAAMPDREAARYLRLDAEIALLRAKRQER